MTAENTARPRRFQTFRYTRPVDRAEDQAEIALCQSDIIQGAIQLAAPGASVNLHAHTGMDEFWMVMAGRARFYGPGRTVMGEFEPGDGLMIPRGTDFSYQSTGEEDLEILRVGALERGIANERIDREPRHPPERRIQRLNGRVL